MRTSSFFSSSSLVFIFEVILIFEVVFMTYFTFLGSGNSGGKQQLIFSAGTAARVFSDIADYNITLSTIKASREAFGLSATK